MEVFGQHHAMIASSPGKNPGTPGTIEQEADLAPVQVRKIWGTEKYFA
jgi:hypothetical protein